MNRKVAFIFQHIPATIVSSIFLIYAFFTSVIYLIVVFIRISLIISDHGPFFLMLTVCFLYFLFFMRLLVLLMSFASDLYIGY